MMIGGKCKWNAFQVIGPALTSSHLLLGSFLSFPNWEISISTIAVFMCRQIVTFLSSVSLASSFFFPFNYGNNSSSTYSHILGFSTIAASLLYVNSIQLLSA